MRSDLACADMSEQARNARASLTELGYKVSSQKASAAKHGYPVSRDGAVAGDTLCDDGLAGGESGQGVVCALSGETVSKAPRIKSPTAPARSP